MEIKEAQEKAWKVIEDWLNKNEIQHDKRTVFPHLIEEVGELAREYNNSINNWREEFDKEKFSDELADVIFHCLILAKDFDVDVEKFLIKKIKKFRKRFELD